LKIENGGTERKEREDVEEKGGTGTDRG